MVNNKRKVVWSNDARLQLRQAYIYIRKDSLQNAEKVKREIISITRQLPENPEKYNPDKYKLENDGSYRYFEKHRYRVVYRVLENEIRILRVKHTSMELLSY